MNRKAEFSTKGFLISVALVVGVMITFGVAATHLSKNYQSLSGVNIDTSSYNTTYYHLDKIEVAGQEIDTQVQGATLGSEDSQTTFYGDIMAALKMASNIYGTAKSMLSGFAKDLQIPAYWGTIVITIMLFMTAFAIIYTIFTKPA